MIFVWLVEYSNLGHAFTKNMKIMSIRLCNWFDSLVVSGLLPNQAYLDRNLEGTFLYNCQIAFFFKLILFVYFTSSCDELYIFHLYTLAAFAIIIP